MNFGTYKLLRQVAQDIRDPAMSAGNGSIAVEGAKKAVCFLVEHVHRHGDITVATRDEFASALREAADAIERNMS